MSRTRASLDFSSLPRPPHASLQMRLFAKLSLCTHTLSHCCSHVASPDHTLILFYPLVLFVFFQSSCFGRYCSLADTALFPSGLLVSIQLQRNDHVTQICSMRAAKPHIFPFFQVPAESQRQWLEPSSHSMTKR